MFALDIWTVIRMSVKRRVFLDNISALYLLFQKIRNQITNLNIPFDVYIGHKNSIKDGNYK